MNGRCLCGAVTFSLEGPVRNVLICHCSLCRRAGTLAGAYTSVTTDTFHLGESDGLAWYSDENGRERGFCERCGATLFWRGASDAISVSAGALDGELRVGAHIFVDSAAGWEAVPDDAAHHAGSPE